jgi:hypothetical protein
LKGLPSCLKIFFGFSSDNAPMFGYPRKPYRLLGWTIAITSMLVLSLSSPTLERVPVKDTNQIDATEDDNNRGYSTIPPENAPSIALLSVVFLLSATGVWSADVMGDSLVAEKAKYETTADRGNLQASCYLLRGFGIACMVPISSLTYNTKNGPRNVTTATTLVPLLLLPFIYRLKEKRRLVPEQSTPEHLHQLWKTTCSRAVWQPMGFMHRWTSKHMHQAVFNQKEYSINQGAQASTQKQLHGRGISSSRPSFGCLPLSLAVA